MNNWYTRNEIQKKLESNPYFGAKVIFGGALILSILFLLRDKVLALSFLTNHYDTLYLTYSICALIWYIYFIFNTKTKIKKEEYIEYLNLLDEKETYEEVSKDREKIMKSISYFKTSADEAKKDLEPLKQKLYLAEQELATQVANNIILKNELNKLKQ